MVRRIYYIEDDDTISSMMKLSLETLNEVYPVKVEIFPLYESFREAIDEVAPDLIIIDLMLPTKSGYDILKELKGSAKFKDIPVIVVSAKLAEYERYICLEAGAVAYFTKPFFGLLELNSAIKNFINIPKDGMVVICGDIVIDRSVRAASRAGVEINLTQKEFELLVYFAKNNNIPLSKEDIFANVWGKKYDNSRSLDMHIKFLRQKVFSDDTSVLQTIQRFGYKLVYEND